MDIAHWWNFSQTFFEKMKKEKKNNGILQEGEQAKILDFRKRNSKFLGKVPAQSWVNLRLT